MLFAYNSPGRPTGYVNDFVGVLSSEEKASLEKRLSDFERRSSSEISVILIKSLDGDTVENYAVKLFSEWEIGKKVKDNGVLLLIAIEDRKMRIEVGYGLEGALTDLQSSSIINNTLKPAFQRGDYYGGIDHAVADIIAATKGEYRSAESQQSNSGDINWISNIFFYIFFFVIWLGSILARSKSWWAGGVVGGVIGIVLSFVFGFLYIGLVSMLLFVPLGLLFDFFVSRAYQRGTQTGHYPWWIGGGPHGGGGKWGGGGFGGFGGGRSGGGGSSGNW